MIVMKFGGTSVESAEAIARVTEIVRDRLHRRPVVVVSAMGKTTNKLLSVAQLAVSGRRDQALAQLYDLRDFHLRESGMERTVEQHFQELAELVKGLAILGELSPRSIDAISSFGERLSSLIVTNYFQHHGLNAVHVPVRLFALVVAGRSPSCPWQQAIRSDANLKDQIAYNEQIIKASKLLATDPKGFEQWQTPKGTYWIPSGSRYVLPFNLAEQERRIYGSGDRFVQSGDVVLDCGANVGVFTREALKAGAAKIISIEPAPENLECLRRNYAAEVASGRVVIYPKGVWDKDDILPMNVDGHNSAADSFVIHPTGSEPTVQGLPLTTVDKLVRELKLERVNFIKMDIEGAEPKALAGARETLATWHPKLAISVYHMPDHPVIIPRVIQAAWSGYQLECGPCARDHATIRPDIYWFH